MLILQNFWFALYIPTAMNEIRYVHSRTIYHFCEANSSSWKLYMVFMALCYLMAIVIYLYYPVRILRLK